MVLFFKFIYIFGHTMKLIGSEFSDQVSDSKMEVRSPNHWTVMEFSPLLIVFLLQYI